jgi:hypothetical protein
MLDSYTRALRPGGRILTHAEGMNWTISGGGSKLTVEDLKDLEFILPLRARKIACEVYALIRC